MPDQLMTFELNGESYGHALVPPVRYWGGQLTRRRDIHLPSFMIFCPKCGDSWGRIAAENSEHFRFSIRSVCTPCGGGLLFSHSSNKDELEHLIRHAPINLITRELLLIASTFKSPETYQEFINRNYW